MRLFVYGTLLDAAGTAPARRLHARVTAVRPARVSGRLLAIPTRNGWFPALVAGRPGERVMGSLCEAALRPADLAWLDRYEGREYRRVGVRVLAGGSSISAQAYRWIAPRPPGACRIAGGDFLAWLAATGAQAYRRPDRRASA